MFPHTHTHKTCALVIINSDIRCCAVAALLLGIYFPSSMFVFPSLPPSNSSRLLKCHCLPTQRSPTQGSPKMLQSHCACSPLPPSHYLGSAIGNCWLPLGFSLITGNIPLRGSKARHKNVLVGMPFLPVAKSGVCKISPAFQVISNMGGKRQGCEYENLSALDVGFARKVITGSAKCAN